MLAVLRRRDFRLLFIGRATSMVGDSLLALVLAIWVKELTGSNGSAGLTLLFMMLPGLFAPLLGWAVDRLPRKPLLIGSYLASAAMLLPLLAVHDKDQTLIVYAVAFGLGVLGIPLLGALAAMTKDMLPEELYAQANGILQTTGQGMQLVAPLAGAGIYAAFGGATVGLLDAATFLVGAAVIVLLPVAPAAARAARAHWFTEISAGVRHLILDPVLRRTTLGLAVVMVTFGLLDSMCFAIVDKGLHRPAAFISVLITAQGLGAVVGGLTAARAVARVGELATAGIGMAVFAVGCTLFATPAGPTALLYAAFAGCVIGGFGVPFAFVAIGTVQQKRTPSELMGRVSTAANTLQSLPYTLAMGLGALLVVLVDYKLVMICAALLIFAASAHLWAARRLTLASVPA